MRIGIGYDIHPLTSNRKLILGGIDVPHYKGLAGHSDADALIHAVCDALLGALGEGDIGSRFPSSDSAFKDVSSIDLLKDVQKLIVARGYELVNIDALIIAQAPRLGPHTHNMRVLIAKTLEINLTRVNIKVKSGEGIDGIGHEEAMAAHAVCLLQETPPTSSKV